MVRAERRLIICFQSILTARNKLAHEKESDILFRNQRRESDMLPRNIQNVFAATIQVIRRFPVPLLFSIAFSAVSVWPRASNPATGCLPFLFCGFFLFLAMTLMAEAYKWSLRLAYFVGTSVLCGIIWGLTKSSSMATSFGFLGLGLFGSFILSPYLTKDAKDSHLWSFIYRVSLRIALTFIAAFILFLGASAIFASLRFLFGLEFYDTIYLDMWLLCATFFAPVFAMTGIPSDFHQEETKHPDALRIILTYILIPLIAIYAVILYVYVAKIVAIWTLPKGGVAYLVSGFGIAGTLVSIASYPWRETKGSLGFYAKWFFRALPIPLVLMSVGLIERINSYGITEGRYAIMLSLAWLAASSVHGLWKQEKYSPRFLLASIVALLLAASFGPWSAVNVSAWSQMSRLQTVLAKNLMLANEHIQKPSITVEHSDLAEISSIVDYLVVTQKTERLKPLFALMPQAYVNKDADKKGGNPAKEILSDMGLKYLSDYAREHHVAENFYFNSDWHDQISVQGYDYLMNVEFSARNGSENFEGKNNAKKIETTLNENIYRVVVEGRDPVLFDVGELVKRRSLDSAVPLFLESRSKDVKAKLVVRNVSGEFVDEEKVHAQVTSMQCLLLFSVTN